MSIQIGPTVFKRRDFNLNRLVMRGGIRYSFEYTDLRFQQFPDDEFFKHSAWPHVTTLDECPDYSIDSSVVLAISAMDMVGDITGRDGSSFAAITSFGLLSC